LTAHKHHPKYAAMMRKVNLFFVIFWLVMIAPTVLVWSTSVLWVGFLSIWALIVSHMDGYLVGGVEQENTTDG
jgi:hypothetical protein